MSSGVSKSSRLGAAKLVVIVALVGCVLCFVAFKSIIVSSSPPSPNSDVKKTSRVKSGSDNTNNANVVVLDVGSKADDELDAEAEQQQRMKLLHEPMDQFTIVMLVYKAPRSLTATLQSLHHSGITTHPQLHSIVVYFQAMDRQRDVNTVTDAIAEYPVEIRLKVRVVGREENLPVAKATFNALSEVNTPLVLYLECDRPALSYRNKELEAFDGQQQHANDVDEEKRKKLRSLIKTPAQRMIDTAIRMLSARKADVFRLQVYANGGLREAEPQLQVKHYGPGPWLEKCSAAPKLSVTECAAAKARGDRAFYGGYCKHWMKVQKEWPQQDMCDATCFPRWRKMVLNASVYGVTQLSEIALRKYKERVVQEEHNSEVLCTDSELCNWTNQPTMYRLEWYERNVKAPCLASPKGCVGSPGRRSAVLQEVFFVKNKEQWANKRHRICLHSRGLFVHQEIDN